jgi:hypothetical protein
MALKLWAERPILNETRGSPDLSLMERWPFTAPHLTSAILISKIESRTAASGQIRPGGFAPLLPFMRPSHMPGSGRSAPIA